jgi:hypothetical protein
VSGTVALVVESALVSLEVIPASVMVAEQTERN